MGLRENFKQAARELTDVTKLMPESSDTNGQVSAEGTPISGASASGYAKNPGHPRRSTPAEPTAAPRQATLIARGTVIRGTVNTEGDLELFGEIQGDISGRGNLKLLGKLGGNAMGANIELCGVRMKGSVSATGKVRIDENSVVIGNLQAESLVLDGKVKGDISVHQELHLAPHAVVAGNLSVGKLTISEGAIIQGEVHMAGTDLEKCFREGTAMEKTEKVVAAVTSH